MVALTKSRLLEDEYECGAMEAGCTFHGWLKRWNLAQLSEHLLDVQM